MEDKEKIQSSGERVVVDRTTLAQLYNIVLDNTSEVMVLIQQMKDHNRKLDYLSNQVQLIEADFKAISAQLVTIINEMEKIRKRTIPKGM